MREKLTRLDPFTQQVARAAFPNYRGRKFYLEARETVNVKSYWDGGSRDFFTFVRLADLATLSMPPQSYFDPAIPGADHAPIPPGFVCVQNRILCGKPAGLTFYVNPADLPRMLPT
jgi:hypothetical protein